MLAHDLHVVPHAPGARVVALALLAHTLRIRGALCLEPEARGEEVRVRVWQHSFVCVV